MQRLGVIEIECRERFFWESMRFLGIIIVVHVLELDPIDIFYLIIYLFIFVGPLDILITVPTIFRPVDKSPNG